VGEPAGSPVALPLPPDVVAWGEGIVRTLNVVHVFLDAAVYLVDGLSAVLRPVAEVAVAADEPAPDPPASPPVDLSAAVPAPLEATVPGWVARSGSAAIVADVTRHPAYGERARPGTRSELAVPIVLDGRVVAVISVRSARVAAFGIADLELVRLLAREAGEALPPALREPLAES
jgi:GAF domain-containing protein